MTTYHDVGYFLDASRMHDPNKLTTCPLCSESVALALHWRTPCFKRCKQCGLIFRDPFPSEAELESLYRSSWSDMEAHSDETGGTDLELGRNIIATLLRELGRQNFSSQRILDFGAGRGAMSMVFREKGADVVAIEPFGYQRLESFDLPVYRDLNGLPSDLRFDGIVAIEVLEHLRDPRGLLRRLYLLLKPGGWLFVTTPNPRGLAARLCGDRWSSASKAGHILFFTAATLHRTLVELGFGTVRQTHWVLRFPGVSPARAFVKSALQLFHLGGGLRFLAFKD